MYILTAIDIFTRTTCAIATKSHSSQTFAHFFFLVMQMFPYVNLLFDDTTAFNEKLKEYLIFYNTKRVHWAFKNKMTPFAVLNASKYYVSKLPTECKNGWGYAKRLNFASKKGIIRKAITTIYSNQKDLQAHGCLNLNEIYVKFITNDRNRRFAECGEVHAF